MAQPLSLHNQGAQFDDSALVDIVDVSVAYGDTQVLTNATLQMAKGETISLLGPSGCGKTTLLRAISGLTVVDSGTISIAGSVVSAKDRNVAPERRQVGMVFQDGALFPHLTVAENVSFGLRGVPDAAKRVSEVLELTGMQKYGHRSPGTLSGGQQQRVALARALAPRPSVLLLDEPFSALDAGLRTQLRRDVKEILHEVGITSIVVTHDQDEAFSMADQVAVMRDGQILQCGTPVELYEHPADHWVASFVGEANEIAGIYTNGRLETVLGQLPVAVRAPDQSRVSAIVRPEQLELVHGTSATVLSVEYFGHDALYEVQKGPDRLEVRMIDASFKPADKVDIKFVGGVVPAWAEGAN